MRFDTLSGELTAKKNGEWIDLDFSAEYKINSDVPVYISNALGLQPIYGGKNRFDYSVEVESEEIVGGINPNFGLLKKVPSRGIIVMGRADTGKYDFVSRFFAPAIGG